MGPSIQHAAMLASDEREPERWGPTGGPVTADGIVALTVAVQGLTTDDETAASLIVADNTDLQPAAGVRALLVVGRNQILNRQTLLYERTAAADANTQQSTDGAQGVQAVAQRASEALLHAPAAAVQATVTKAGVAGGCIVVTGIQASIATAGAASGIQTVQLVDGTAAVLWSMDLQAAATSADRVQLTGLNIVVAQDQGVTLRFAAAGPAGSVQKVCLQCHVAA